MSDRSHNPRSPVRSPNPSSRRAPLSSPDAFSVAATEEIELRKRVRDLRMQQLESEIKARRFEFLREDEQIRAEIIRLRKQLLEAASLSPSSSSSTSARSTSIHTAAAINTTERGLPSLTTRSPPHFNPPR